MAANVLTVIIDVSKMGLAVSVKRCQTKKSAVILHAVTMYKQ